MLSLPTDNVCHRPVPQRAVRINLHIFGLLEIVRAPSFSEANVTLGTDLFLSKRLHWFNGRRTLCRKQTRPKSNQGQAGYGNH